MQLTVLGSSSSGNGYILSNEDVAIVIECGLPLMEVKKALNFNIKKILFGWVSHSHGDHSGKIKEYLNAGIQIYTSEDTIREMGIHHHNLHPIEPKVQYMIGDFVIKCYPVKHDVTCFMLLLKTPNDNQICFITDTHFIPYSPKGINNLIIESNFADEILNDSSAPVFLKKRVLTSHLSFDLCKDFLKNMDKSVLNNVVLCHLSDRNSHAEYFKKEVELLTGKTTHIAEKGMSINFDKKPF